MSTPPVGWRRWSGMPTVLALFLAVGLTAACSDGPTQVSSAGVADASSPPSGSDVTLTSGNQDCDDLFDDRVQEFKIDKVPEEKTYTDLDGPLSVEITAVKAGETVFDWTSDPSVDGVIVKGGPNANFYEYDPESDGDSDLTTPERDNSGSHYEISHVTFCYDVEDARISIEADGANEVEDAHTFTATVEQKIEDGDWTAVGDTEVSFSLSPVHGSGASFVDGEDTCTTDAGGQCKVEINSSSAGTFEVAASATVEVDNASTAELDVESEAATKVYADASIGITPQNATNDLDEEHVFTVSVTGDDGDGDDPHGVEGVNPTVTISPSGFTLVDDSCADDGTDTAGQCTVTINSSTEATYTANVSATVDVVTTEGTVSGITRSTDGDSGPDGTGPATKEYVEDGGGLDPGGEPGDACTYTQGFWKTHADEWPEGHNPDATFYNSGDSWMKVLETPTRGNGYYILAHQFIAATLNVAKEESPTVPGDVSDALDEAEDFFGSNDVLNGDGDRWDPKSEVGSSGSTFEELATLLDEFNNGELEGVTHCDDLEEEEEEEEE